MQAVVYSRFNRNIFTQDSIWNNRDKLDALVFAAPERPFLRTLVAGRWAKALEAPGRGPERGVERGLAEFTQGRCKPIVNGLGCHVADA